MYVLLGVVKVDYGMIWTRCDIWKREGHDDKAHGLSGLDLFLTRPTGRCLFYAIVSTFCRSFLMCFQAC